MRNTAQGLLCGVVLATVGFSIHHFQRPAIAERPLANRWSSELAAGMEDDLIAFSSPDSRQLTLIDKIRRTMSVYHIDAKSGQITLRGVRNFRWDLELDDFNGAEPSPVHIRSMVESP
jgi:hypothetical protein